MGGAQGSSEVGARCTHQGFGIAGTWTLDHGGEDEDLNMGGGEEWKERDHLRRRSRDDTGVDVVVENHAWTDLSVYASTGGGQHRLGHVTSGRTATFRIPSMAHRVMDVELFADPLASSELHRSGRFIVREGQRVVWTVHENRLGGELTIR